MKLPEVTIEQLLDAGIHFGHNTRRWNPKMEQYIFGVRNKIHIIDLRISLPLIHNALIKLYEIVSKSGKVLIILSILSTSSSESFIPTIFFGYLEISFSIIFKSILIPDILGIW